jgi:hypothetical protein
LIFLERFALYFTPPFAISLDQKYHRWRLPLMGFILRFQLWINRIFKPGENDSEAKLCRWKDGIEATGSQKLFETYYLLLGFLPISSTV